MKLQNFLKISIRSEDTSLITPLCNSCQEDKPICKYLLAKFVKVLWRDSFSQYVWIRRLVCIITLYFTGTSAELLFYNSFWQPQSHDSTHNGTRERVAQSSDLNKGL